MRTTAAYFCVMMFLIGAFGGRVSAQDRAPAPACAVPNQAARTLTAATPILPAYAKQINASGTVFVLVDLDANSNVTGTRVVQSASPVLNNAALEAIRASSFSTTISNCVPIVGSLIVPVTFTDTGALPLMAPPAMLAYFAGGWSCATKLGSFTVRLFGLNGPKTSLISANAFTDANGTIYQTSESYTQQGDAISVLQRVGFQFTGTSNGWDGDTLAFKGVETSGSTASAQTMTYKRVDKDHFLRSFSNVPASGGPPVVTSMEQCARIPAAVFKP